MQRGGLTSGTVLLSACVVLGCGPGETKTHGGSTVNARSRAAAGLARPLYPLCTLDQFQRPKVTPIAGPPGTGRSWQLTFIPRRGPNLTTVGNTQTVLVVEQPPSVNQTGFRG